MLLKWFMLCATRSTTTPQNTSNWAYAYGKYIIHISPQQATRTRERRVRAHISPMACKRWRRRRRQQSRTVTYSTFQMKNSWTTNKCVVFSECESVTFTATTATLPPSATRVACRYQREAAIKREKDMKSLRERERQKGGMRNIVRRKRITCAWLCGFLFPSALKVFVFRYIANVCQPQ